MSYHIGSFNIRDFNYSNTSSDGEKLKRDFNKIAQIIVEEKFDVVAIQEVNAESPLRYLISILNGKYKNVSREYSYTFGGDMPTSSKDPERYGFIWNNKRLRLLEIPGKKNPTYYQNAGGVTLQRPPYYIRLTARGMLGGTNFELRLVNVHILDSKYEPDRIAEFDILVKQVLPRICDHQELSIGMEMMPAYTFLLGDYNICLNKGSRAIFKIDSITSTNYTGRKRYFKTVQESETSLRMAHDQQSIEACYANNYDHFTYEMDLIGKLKMTEANRVEALTKYFPEENEIVNKLQGYREKVSDHVPIKLSIDLK